MSVPVLNQLLIRQRKWKWRSTAETANQSQPTPHTRHRAFWSTLSSHLATGAKTYNRRYPMTAIQTLSPQPLEPCLFPKLRHYFADFPYLRSSNWPEASNLGDLLRLWVRPGSIIIVSPGFSRDEHCAPDTSKGDVLFQLSDPISEWCISRVIDHQHIYINIPLPPSVKKKRRRLRSTVIYSC